MKFMTIFALFIFLAGNSLLFAHCEIPCGIYDDGTRIKLMKEHTQTISKSIAAITKLSGEKTPDFNQIVRWTTNKEEHAVKIQDIVSQYFLTQRIKAPDKQDKKAAGAYHAKLSALHTILVYAMKAKQSTNPENPKQLLAAIEAFEKLYMVKKN